MGGRRLGDRGVGRKNQAPVQRGGDNDDHDFEEDHGDHDDDEEDDHDHDEDSVLRC